MAIATAAITTVFLGTPQISADDNKKETEKAIEKG